MSRRQHIQHLVAEQERRRANAASLLGDGNALLDSDYEDDNWLIGLVPGPGDGNNSVGPRRRENSVNSDDSESEDEGGVQGVVRDSVARSSLAGNDNDFLPDDEKPAASGSENEEPGDESSNDERTSVPGGRANFDANESLGPERVVVEGPSILNFPNNINTSENASGGDTAAPSPSVASKQSNRIGAFIDSDGEHDNMTEVFTLSMKRSTTDDRPPFENPSKRSRTDDLRLSSAGSSQIIESSTQPELASDQMIPAYQSSQPHEQNDVQQTVGSARQWFDFSTVPGNKSNSSFYYLRDQEEIMDNDRLLDVGREIRDFLRYKHHLNGARRMVRKSDLRITKAGFGLLPQDQQQACLRRKEFQDYVYEHACQMIMRQPTLNTPIRRAHPTTGEQVEWLIQPAKWNRKNGGIRNPENVFLVIEMEVFGTPYSEIAAILNLSHTRFGLESPNYTAGAMQSKYNRYYKDFAKQEGRACSDWNQRDWLNPDGTVCIKARQNKETKARIAADATAAAQKEIVSGIENPAQQLVDTEDDDLREYLMTARRFLAVDIQGADRYSQLLKAVNEMTKEQERVYTFDDIVHACFRHRF